MPEQVSIIKKVNSASNSDDGYDSCPDSLTEVQVKTLSDAKMKSGSQHSGSRFEFSFQVDASRMHSPDKVVGQLLKSKTTETDKKKIIDRSA